MAFKKEFIAFEIAPDFLDELSMRTTAFEESFASHNASKTAPAGATPQINDAMDRATVVLEKLDGDAVGFQNWRNVRHVERAWVSKKTEETKPAAAA